MIPQEELQRLLDKATKDINAFMCKPLTFDDHSDLAELYFSRGDIHFTMKNYKAAMEDYEICMDYDPYFIEADSRMDRIMEVMLPLALSGK